MESAKQITLTEVPTGTAGSGNVIPGDDLEVALAKHENKIAGNTANLASINQDNVTVNIYKVSNFGTP